MSIAYQLSYTTFTGNGNVSVYQVDFPVREVTHIVVTGTTASGVAFGYTRGVEYTVALRTNAAGESIGATITLTQPLASGWKMVVARVVPIVQESVFSNQGGMQPKVVERQLDYLTMICQQLYYQTYLGDATLAGIRSELDSIPSTYLKLSGGTLTGDLTLAASRSVSFANSTAAPKINLHGANYSIGVQSATVYARTGGAFRVYRGGVHEPDPVPGAGGIELLSVDATDIYYRGVGLRAELDGKAPLVHTHIVDDIPGLRAELDGKLDAVALEGAMDAAKAELFAAMAAMENRFSAAVAALESRMEAEVAGLMPAAPEGDRMWVGSGRNWQPLVFLGGEPFERDGDFVSAVVRPTYTPSLWNVGDFVTIRPDVSPGDEDAYFRCDDQGFVVLKSA